MKLRLKFPHCLLENQENSFESRMERLWEKREYTQGNETSKYELYSCRGPVVSGIHDLYLSLKERIIKDLFRI